MGYARRPAAYRAAPGIMSKSVIFHVFYPLPNRSAPKFAFNLHVGDVPDIITCAKFQNEILIGCDTTGGRNSYFPVNF